MQAHDIYQYIYENKNLTYAVGQIRLQISMSFSFGLFRVVDQDFREDFSF